MAKQLNQHVNNIKKFNQDIIFWLRLSGFAAISILLMVVDLSFFKNERIHWFFISTGLALSVIWWYWTMRLIKEILNYQLSEIEILSDIVTDIQEIKKDVRNLDKES